MSFKRDGDDFYLLNNLKKRRVSELLSTYIPEDEAILMKNGKFACIVCHYRPVFDTMAVLAVHRQGKKHLTQLSIYLQNKEEIRQLKLKRKHELYLKHDETNDKSLLKVGPSIEKPKLSHHSLLHTPVYNSCCKKRSGNGLGRKTRIDLHLEKKSNCAASVIDTKSDYCIPSSLSVIKKDLETDCGNVRTIPVDKLAKKAVNQYLKTLGRKRPFNQVVDQARNSYHFCNKQNKIESASEQSQAQNEIESSRPLMKDICKPQVDPEKVKRAEYYLNLRSLGWKIDGCGNWSKDEDAEFDSDEEQPPPMPP